MNQHQYIENEDLESGIIIKAGKGQFREVGKAWKALIRATYSTVSEDQFHLFRTWRYVVPDKPDAGALEDQRGDFEATLT